MVKFPTSYFLHDSDSHGSALLGLYISSNTIICSTMSFHPLGNSNQVAVSVSIDVPLKSKLDVPFHHIAHDNSHVYWVTLDHLRDVPWQDIFKLSASPAACEFCEWFQVQIDLYIPHCNCLNNLLGF